MLVRKIPDFSKNIDIRPYGHMNQMMIVSLSWFPNTGTHRALKALTDGEIPTSSSELLLDLL